ncbi:MAG: response regulator, partial [Candidatus Omnitrophica bacterium]|nr:response regulator [Candidatus Omnitrophota bacterium]
MKKKKIIIIDDEKGFTELVKTVLEETGEYEVIEENDGQKGYLTVLREGPALILLDLMMPGADGAEIAEKIKRDEDLKGTPIIFLTAAATEGET